MAKKRQWWKYKDCTPKQFRTAKGRYMDAVKSRGKRDYYKVRIIVPKEYLLAFSPMEAIVLSFLYFYASGEEAQGQTVDDWFRISSVRLREALCLSVDQERYVLEQLKKKELLEQKMMGNPAKRHLRLVPEAIVHDFIQKVFVEEDEEV